MKEISHKGHNELQFERCQQIDSHEFQELWYSLESLCMNVKLYYF